MIIIPTRAGGCGRSEQDPTMLKLNVPITKGNVPSIRMIQDGCIQREHRYQLVVRHPVVSPIKPRRFLCPIADGDHVGRRDNFGFSPWTFRSVRVIVSKFDTNDVTKPNIPPGPRRAVP